MAKMYVNLKTMTRGLAFFNVSCIKQNIPEIELREFTNKPRQAHGILYIACKTAVFTTEDGLRHTFKRGNLVYLPKGLKYTAFLSGGSLSDFTSLQLYYHLLDKRGNDYYISDQPTCLTENTPDTIIGNLIDMAYETVNSEYPTFTINKLFFEMMETVAKLMWLPDISESGNKVIPAIYYLSLHLNDDIPVPYLAKLCMMSESSFRREFEAATGKSPALYKSTLKISKAKELIRMDPTISTATLVEELGFSDASYFYKTFERITGMSLKEYRKSVK
ncbi:MAG: helix-turn-helix transcriptional regulator [Ruminococcaceae bacterium]|nr:helix-turn-helix transcriptional regulator [Oscillospiraceae bacterium]